MAGIGIISNPYAKVNKRDPEHNTLLWYVLGKRGQYEVTESLTDLSRVCEEFKQREISTIGIVGGDGTISLTLSAVLEAYGPQNLPKILILRGGTVNVLAANLGIFGKPKDVMADFMESFHSDKTLYEMSLSTLLVNGRLGFLFANGAASSFLEEFYRNKSNALGAALFFGRTLGDGLSRGSLDGSFERLSRPGKMTITSTPHPLRGMAGTTQDYTMVLAATIPKMPFGIRLFRNITSVSDKAEMIAIASKGSDLLRQVSRTCVGSQLNSPNIGQALFERAVIDVAPGSLYSVDGDLLRTADGKITIEVGPRFVFCSPYGKVL